MNKTFNNKILLRLLAIIFIIMTIAVSSVYVFLYHPPEFLETYSYSSRKYLIDSFLNSGEPNASNLRYKLIIDKKDYQIFRKPYLGDKIVAINNDVAVLMKEIGKDQKLIIYENYRSSFFAHTVDVNERYFPGLLKNSKIAYCMLLPYLRNTDGKSLTNSWRLVVVTDKSQLYHNFPNRNNKFDGISKLGDIVTFEESAVWDLPKRKYPTMNINCSEVERYFPWLPDEAYAYHPILNTDNNYKDVYGNGGFGKSATVYENGKPTEVSRFYVPKRTIEANSFLPMGGYEPDSKMTLLGTYRSNTDSGVRIGIFATSDGGRNWFCKYEFGDLGHYPFRQGIIKNWGHNFGNAIDTSSTKNRYVTNSFYLMKRNVIVPSASNPDPTKKFEWGNRVDISEILSGNQTVIKTTKPHKLETGNIIVIQNSAVSKRPGAEWQWMTNDTVSSMSAGNGLLFKVEGIDDNSFRLHEYVSSPDNNITCRHIHHINRVKDGWIIGTGEVYPNGWIFYMQMKEADTFSLKSASESLRVIRLNSSEKSVQRTLGFILYDDKETTVLFASDADTIDRKSVKMPFGRKETFSRSSMGIFRGKLVDIDDFDKFETIYEAKEPAYFFKKLGDAIVFSGQRGEIAISLDDGKTWHQERIDRHLQHYYGRSYSFFVIDDYIIKIK